MQLLQVQEYRKRLQELFMLHQEALIAENLPLADKLIEIYADLLGAIKRIDLVVVSLHENYVERSQVRRFEFQSLQNEIDELLINTISRLGKCHPINGSLRRFVIEMIEYETMLKQACLEFDSKAFPALVDDINKTIDEPRLKALTSGLETGVSLAFERANRMLNRLMPKLA